MNKREAIETIVESINHSEADEISRIDALSKDERREEYLRVANRIDKGRRERKCSRKEAFVVKDAMRLLYDQHPNSQDFSDATNLVAGLVFFGMCGYVGYLGIIKPLIEYFSK